MRWSRISLLGGERIKGRGRDAYGGDGDGTGDGGFDPFQVLDLPVSFIRLVNSQPLKSSNERFRFCPRPVSESDRGQVRRMIVLLPQCTGRLGEYGMYLKSLRDERTRKADSNPRVARMELRL